MKAKVELHPERWDDVLFLHINAEALEREPDDLEETILYHYKTTWGENKKVRLALSLKPLPELTKEQAWRVLGLQHSMAPWGFDLPLCEVNPEQLETLRRVDSKGEMIVLDLNRPEKPPGWLPCGGREFFYENRSRKTNEELLPLAGMCVAWSADGTQVLASGPTWDDVEVQLAEKGIDHHDVMHEYFDLEG